MERRTMNEDEMANKLTELLDIAVKIDKEYELACIINIQPMKHDNCYQVTVSIGEQQRQAAITGAVSAQLKALDIAQDMISKAIVPWQAPADQEAIKTLAKSFIVATIPLREDLG